MPWVSMKEASSAAAVHFDTVRRWVREGQIEARHLPGGRLVRVQVDGEGLPVPAACRGRRAAPQARRGGRQCSNAR
jgi:excisionase family DNA binding protein